MHISKFKATKLSCQKHTLVGVVNLLTQYGNLDCFPALSLAAMFSLMHICKCTISVSSHLITGSSMALCLRTKQLNELHNPKGSYLIGKSESTLI